MHSTKQIPVGTPVLLRLQSGKETTGQVAFCKGSAANENLWGLGIVLNEPGNFWGLNPCPKDWISGPDDVASSPASSGPVSTKEHRPIADDLRADNDTMRAEFLEQMRKEIETVCAHARERFEEELQAQRKSTALAETVLRDATTARESLAASVQSLPETLDHKVKDGVDKALQQIKTCVKTAKKEAADDLEHDVQKSFSAELAKAQQEFRKVTDDHLEQKKKEIADATSSMGDASDQIYTTLRQRLEDEFKSKQELISSIQEAMGSDADRLRSEAGNVDDRIAKVEELLLNMKSDLSDRMDQMVAETIGKARTSVEALLSEMQTHQMALVREEMQGTLNPVSSRAESLINELRPLLDTLTLERDETQIQISAIGQEKETLRLWLVQQGQDFRKTIEDALRDAATRGKASVQDALNMIQNPIEKLSREAKSKIDEVTARQHADLDEGIRRLRDQMATLEQQAEESIRASLLSTNEISTENQTLPSDKVDPSPTDAETPSARGQTTFAQKLSGLVRGPKR